ncbi:signal recognition particle-docking protein FtsY [Pseudofulvimonas gallinarii]
MQRLSSGRAGALAIPRDPPRRLPDRHAMLGFFRKKKTVEPAAPAAGDSPSVDTTIETPPQVDVAAENAPAAMDAANLPAAPAPVAAAPAVAAAAPPPAPAAPVARAKPSWRERLSNSSLGLGIRALFSGNKPLDEDLLEELETVLLTADVGVAATNELVDALRRGIKARSYADSNALLADLRTRLRALIDPVARPLAIDPSVQPFVILVVGVNGVGKTTTIGKLARRYHEQGLAVTLAAGDTFRAAAVAQLQTWGERTGIAVYAQGQGADSASVIFDALQSSRSRGAQLLIADTAGRLHTQSGLMDELAKIRRVMAKLDGNAPHEVLQVIDGTTGQNAVNQVRQFHQAAGVTGLVVTKLDGSAKGGVVFALAREFGLPIRFVGLGEGVEDLQVFDPDAFIDGLLPDSLGR